MPAAQIFTIGHSNHTREEFFRLLQLSKIDHVVDVRSYPGSRFCPQFNSTTFRAHVEDAGMSYHFLGETLGGRSDNPSLYLEGQLQYVRLAGTSRYQIGIRQLLDIIQTGIDAKTAIMCSEGDPSVCHRTLLISRSLVEKDYHQPPEHILRDGSIIGHIQLMNQLMIENKVDSLEAAYEAQSEKVAPRRKIPGIW